MIHNLSIQSAAAPDARNNNGSGHKYQVLAGSEFINSSLKDMIAETKEKALVFLSDKGIKNLYHGGILDEFVRVTGSGVKVILQTQHVHPERRVIDEIRKRFAINLTDETMPVSFIIVDDSEATKAG